MHIKKSEYAKREKRNFLFVARSEKKITISTCPITIASSTSTEVKKDYNILRLIRIVYVSTLSAITHRNGHDNAEWKCKVDPFIESAYVVS